MARDWKPGDVALRTMPFGLPSGVSMVVTGTDCPVYRDGEPIHPRRPHWHHQQGGWDRLNESGTFATYRPLLVIDPESLDDVRRVRDGCWRGGTVEDWQGGLRSLLSPKPTEPSDPSARVRADGTEWAKVTTWWVSPDMGQVPREWDWLVEREDFRVMAP